MSIFVTTAIAGDIFRNEPSLSSASATIKSPWPRSTFAPTLFSFPPITTVGSNPPLSRTLEIIEVVDVLPCVPVTAMLYFKRISSASISALGITGIDISRAATTSGFPGLIADDVTTTSAPLICSLECPLNTMHPSLSRCSVMDDNFTSDPETLYPRLRSSSAIPLIPMPPIPTKCM